VHATEAVDFDPTDRSEVEPYVTSRRRGCSRTATGLEITPESTRGLGEDPQSLDTYHAQDTRRMRLVG
jgi:hypothetical protein